MPPHGFTECAKTPAHQRIFSQYIFSHFRQWSSFTGNFREARVGKTNTMNKNKCSSTLLPIHFLFLLHGTSCNNSEHVANYVPHTREASYHLGSWFSEVPMTRHKWKTIWKSPNKKFSGCRTLNRKDVPTLRTVHQIILNFSWMIYQLHSLMLSNAGILRMINYEADGVCCGGN
jgi:hypothetical protein